MAVVSSSYQALSAPTFAKIGERRIERTQNKTSLQSSFSGKNLSVAHSPLVTRSCSKVYRASVNSQRYNSPVTSQASWDYETSHGVSSIWSIRRDLKVPYSALMGVYANQGQPSPMVQERFQSVISQLFQNRIIRCGGGVDDDMANLIVAQLLYLDAADPNRDIVMYVNSPGGSVTAGMAVFDTMRHIRPSVSTVCVGLAASMGAFLLSAGTKGKRYSLPNSRIMIHQPLGGAQGQQTDIEIQANEILHHKANLNGYLAYHTGQTYEKITQDTDRDFFMSAKEAQAYGLIDAVITNPLKALKPLSLEEEGRLLDETIAKPVEAAEAQPAEEEKAPAAEATPSEEGGEKEQSAA